MHQKAQKKLHNKMGMEKIRGKQCKILMRKKPAKIELHQTWVEKKWKESQNAEVKALKVGKKWKNQGNYKKGRKFGGR